MIEVIEDDVNNAVLQVTNGLMWPKEAAMTYNKNVILYITG